MEKLTDIEKAMLLTIIQGEIERLEEMEYQLSKKEKQKRALEFTSNRLKAVNNIYEKVRKEMLYEN